MSLVFGVYRLVELIMRINNAPPAFPLQNLIQPPQRAQPPPPPQRAQPLPPPQRAQPPPPQREQLQPPQAVQLPTLRRSGRKTTTPNRLNL